MNDVVKKRGRWWLWIVAALLVLLVTAWFVVSSSAFVRAVVLPRVAAATGCDLTVEHISLSPLSQITLHKLRLTPSGSEILLTVESARVRYDGLGFLRGAIRIQEVTLETPVVTVVEGADGKSNLDRLLASLSSGSKSPGNAASAPPTIDVANISLRNTTLRKTRPIGRAGIQVMELSNLNLALDHLKNGGSGRLTLDGLGRFLQPVDDTLEVRLAGGVDLTLGEDLQPRIVNGSFSNRISTAKGAFQSFASLEAVVASDLTPTEVRSLGIRFRQNGRDLGQIRVNGPVDLAKKSGNLTYEVSGIDRRVLGLLGASAGGLDLGRTTLTASGRVDLSGGGKNFASEGRLQVGNFVVSSTNGVTPVLDLDVAYQGAVNLEDSTAVVNKLDLSGKQGNRALLKASLDRAMTLAWGKGGSGFRESTFTLDLTGLALAEWRPLLGPEIPSGDLDAKIQVRAEKEGRVLRFSLGGEGRNLAARVAGSRVENATLKLAAEGSVENLKVVAVEKFSLTLQQAGQALGAVDGRLDFNPDTLAANAQFNGSAILPSVTGLFPVPGLTARAGEVKFTGLLAGKSTGTNLSVSVDLARFSGNYGNFLFNEYPANLILAAGFVNSEVRVSRATVTAGQGGALDLSGNYNVDRRKGHLVAKSRNLNQSALGPFLAVAFQPKTLQSLSIDLDLTADVDADGDSQLSGEVQMKNLVVHDNGRPIGLPAKLSASIDGGMKGSLVEIRRLLLAIDPTSQATNQLTASARLDLGSNKPVPSSFSVQSDGLDLTAYYDIFVRNPVEGTPPTVPGKASQARAEVEPAPIPLPIQKLAGEIRIKRLLLHDIAISNWTAKVSVDRGVVRLDPVALSLNGAPITSRVKLDLSVPGFGYDLDLTADGMPIAPINDLLDPASAGRLAGTLTLKSHFQGNGITGLNLQKNLTGQFEMGATNLNLAVAQLKSPILKTLVSVILGIPAAIKNPAGALGNIVSQLTGSTKPASAQSGWADELSKSPIDALQVNATVGSSKVQFQRTSVQSRAFLAESSGTVSLAPILTNSTLAAPVVVSLRRPLAEFIGLLPADSPTNAVYVRLPDFLSLKGTLGKPKADMNHFVLAKLALKSVGGLGGQSLKPVREKGGNLLQGLGNLLNRAQPTAATNTSSPAFRPTAPTTVPSKSAIPQETQPLLKTGPPPATNRTIQIDPFRSLFKGSKTNNPAPK
ncbi:MAG: AsmA family protein [Pedosphaera sp.]|nr:AsmA family protein [Pedosphaera sp.]